MSENPTEPEKSAKKLIFMVLGAVVLLAAGGGAGYYFSASHKEDSFKNDKKKAHGEKSEEEEEQKVEKEYYDLGKPLVFNFSNSPTVKFVQVSLSFLVEGADTVDALNKNEPMIRNNLLMLINGKDVETLKTKEGKEKLRAEVLKEVSGILKKMIGKSRLTDVYFTSFIMQ